MADANLDTNDTSNTQNDNTQDDNNQANLDQARAFIQTEVANAFKAQQDANTQSDTQSDDTNNRQLQDMIDPFIQPGLNEARFTAADAKDYVDFYTSNPDASTRKDAIEATFNELAKAGKATTRESVNMYLEGREALTNPDAYTDKQLAKRKAQEDKAANAVDVGANSMFRGENHPTFGKGFEDKTSDEMAEALKGIAF